MRVSLYGTMGSIAGGFSDLGRNTTSVVIHNGDKDLIVDLGTGVLQHMIGNDDLEHHILLTHYHLDHILGFPFVPQLFSRDYTLHLYGPQSSDKSIAEELVGVMREPFLPIKREHILATITSNPIVEKTRYMVNGFAVEAFHINHPGGSYVYAIQADGKKVVVLCDLPNGMESNEELIAFCSKSDLIYVDAMFVESEFENVKLLQYGHSSVESAIRLFRKTASQKLVLGHHKISRQYDDLKHYETDDIVVGRDDMEFQL